MPRKTTSNLKDALSPRSYRNLLYGAVTVVVLFIVIFFGLRALSDRNGEITEEAQNVNEEQNTYTVAEGDNLWSIAEKEYNDGYKWTEIAEENNLENPDAIETGMELTLPEAESEVAMGEQEATGSAQTLTGDSYTVVEGDNLWNIAVRAYGDGYKWTEIANANELANPDLIYPNDKLSLPR